MIIRRIIFFLLFSISFSGWLRAQMIQTDPQSIVSDILEDLTAASEDDIDLDALAEDLIFFLDNPINLNSASYEQLSRLVFLSEFQIQSVIDYVKKNGEMLTIYELQLVFGFEYTDVTRLLPFVTVGKTDKEKTAFPVFMHGKHDLFVRGKTMLETPTGYTSPPDDNPSASRYAGNKLNLYTRYSYKTRGGLQFGFVAEKDPGEEFFKGSNPYGFDYYSFHLQMSDVGKIKTIVVGDFNAEFGQGLTLWSGTSFGKSSDPLGVRKRPKGLNRYSSANENLFLRGGGATVKFGMFEVTAFASYKKIDANIADSLIDGLDYVTSIPTSGLHRTTSEISNKKTLGEMLAGGNVSFSWKNIRGGVTASYVNLQGAFRPQSQLYSQFEPLLENRMNVGADVNFALGSHLIFGEVSNTVGYGMGAIGGGLFRLNSLINLSVLARSYQKDFSTYYTTALAEGTGPANEKGVLIGIGFKPIKFWEVTGYADFFKFPWLRFGVNGPSRGQDYSLQATYSPRSRLSFNIRYRYKEKDQNREVDSAQIRWILPYNRQGLRFHISFSPSRTIDLKSRVEFAWFEKENLPVERGLLLYQDISYKPVSIPLELTTRFAVFETDSWDARMYAYESDVLYSFSIPAYYSKGTRVYLLAKYSIRDNVDIWFRVSQTFFATEATLGSGLDMIDGSSRSEAKIQLRVKF